jgi:hypothetical protein
MFNNIVIISDMYVSRFGPILCNLAFIYLHENYSVYRSFNYLSNSENRMQIGLKLAELLEQIQNYFIKTCISLFNIHVYACVLSVFEF